MARQIKNVVWHMAYARVSSSGDVIIKLADGGHAIFKWYEAVMGRVKDVAMARAGDKAWGKMRSNTLEITEVNAIGRYVKSS